MQERRAHRRKRVVLPVKVSAAQTGSVLAHTIDINCAGARLGGLRAQLAPGTIIHLQRGSRKAKFRVIWAQQIASNEIQVGIEALERNDQFWGVDLLSDERATQQDTEALLTLLGRNPKLELRNLP